MTANIWEVVDYQILAGESCLNVFHYIDSAGTADPTVLMADLVAHYIPAVAVDQHTALSHVQLSYRQVYPTAALGVVYTTGLPINGAISASDVLANAFALSVKWTIGTTTNLVGGTLPHIKRGGARIAGATEGDVSGNNIAGTVAADWATAFGHLVTDTSEAFQLVVASFLDASRVRQHTVQQYAHVLASSAPSPSTQNSRKILRGRIS